MAKITLIGLLGIAQLLWAQSCPDVRVTDSNTASINMALSYTSGNVGYLPGIRFDRDTFQRLGQMLPGPDLHIGAGAVPNKAQIIMQIKGLISDKQNVMFNYSGHGLPFPSVDENDKVTMDSGWAIPLPNIPDYCLSTFEIINKQIRDIYWNRMMVKLAKDRIAQLKKSIEAEKNNSTISTLKKEIDQKNSEIEKTEAVTKELFDVYSDDRKNYDECQEFVISGKEIMNLFRGKTVVGMVDACFSGALIHEDTKGSTVCIACSSRDHETSADGASAFYPEQGVKDFYQSLKGFEDKYSGTQWPKKTILVDVAENGKMSEFGEQTYKKMSTKTKKAFDVDLAKAKKLYQDKLNLEALIVKARHLKGGVLVSYLRSRGLGADQNGDSKITLEEFYSNLPGKFYQNTDFVQFPRVQNPVMLTAGCSDSFKNFIIDPKWLEKIKGNYSEPAHQGEFPELGQQSKKH